MSSALDALLGRLFDDGDELELLGGINWIGFTIERDDANNRYDITSAVGSLDSDDISNVSAVSGATVSAALNTLNTAVGLRALAATQVIAGAGLTGGGTLGADRTLNVAAADGTITVNADSIQVGTLVAGNYSNNTIALARLVNASAQFQIVARKTSSGGAWEDCSRSELGLALSATTITAGTNLTGGGDLSANRTLNVSATLTGITSINGATVAAPTEGAQITTTATINVTQGSNRTVTAAGGAYAITLATTGAITGDVLSLICSNALANAITVTNGGGGGGNIGPSAGTMPASAKRVYDYRYDGTNWAYSGSKLLV